MPGMRTRISAIRLDRSQLKGDAQTDAVKLELFDFVLPAPLQYTSDIIDALLFNAPCFSVCTCNQRRHFSRKRRSGKFPRCVLQGKSESRLPQPGFLWAKAKRSEAS